MSEAAKTLDKLEIEYEILIVSAHRTPEKMYDYAKTARQRGLKVIIAGAGGAAHLPGMVAAVTDLPVIGVPIKSKALKGIDSLYSIVQMPAGVPVATVAIDGAQNAALLAAQIIGAFEAEVAVKIQEHKMNLKNTVSEKSEKLEEIGYEEYLRGIVYEKSNSNNS
jgi:5-(carboxyamino)imidazole ribonucleotide mutase